MEVLTESASLILKSGTKPIILAAEDPGQEVYQSFFWDKIDFRICSFQEALVFLSINQAEIILIDCGVNVAYGLKYLSMIKATHTDTPIIFITEISSENIAIEAFSIGVRKFLKKPFNMDELKECILYISNIRRSSKERRMPLYMNNAMNNTAYQIDSGLPANMLDVVRYIDNNISNEISLDALAKEASISKFHFCKLFKKHFGMAPLKYVTAKRIEKAKKLLPRKEFNVSGVAFEVGFGDLSTFNKHFKKYTGVSPTTYRLSCKSINPKDAFTFKIR